MNKKSSPTASETANSKLAVQISAAQKTADAAKKSAKAAKAAFRQAKKDFKEARRLAKSAKKAVKELKAQFAASPVRKPAPRKHASVPVTSAKPIADSSLPPPAPDSSVIEPS